MRRNKEFDFYDATNLKSYNLDGQIRYQLKLLDGLDAYTRKHSENVANLTCRICEYMKFKKGFIIYCTTCAYLHDIGKLFIKPSILQKNGQLTDEEYEIIKSHTTLGYKMCMQDPKLKPYYAGPLYHHESLDGTGYPNKLVGNKIPIEGQIIRVADEFDALTSKRQYKTHIGIIDTVNILYKETSHTPEKYDKTDSVIKAITYMFKETFSTKNLIYGKIDPKIFKALLKVIIDDIECEISSHYDSLSYIKTELKRLSKALKYYNKMENATTIELRQYHYTEARFYLYKNELVENIPTEIDDYKKSYANKVTTIKKLYHEIKEIKKIIDKI